MEENHLFQERIIDCVDCLDSTERMAFVCVYISEKSREPFHGLLLGRVMGLPDTPEDPGLVLFYLQTSARVLEELWNAIQSHNFERDHVHIFYFFYLPMKMAWIAGACAAAFCVMSAILIITHTPGHWDILHNPVMTLLGYWWFFLIVSASGIIVAFLAGYIGRWLAYPLIGIQIARIEKKAQMNAYYRRQLAGLRLPNVSPFYAFMGKFVKGTYEFEDQVAHH